MGRYRLTRLLGQGGMGRVYEGELEGPAGFRKSVAVKVLKEGGEALVREARLGGLLRHPNLVEVYELGLEGDTWYCVMELVRGGSIRSRIPMSEQAAIEVGLQVTAGLQHAHEAVGLVHLDLKPENLLLDHGTVKVADLGVARARGFGGDGRVQGTPAYMAPERLAGGAVDARADVYALGVVLAELVTGSREVRPEALGRLGPLVARCTAASPSDRYPSMAAVAWDLRALEGTGEGLAAAALTTGEPGAPRTDTFSWTSQPTASNLGDALDHFVGRADDLAAVEAALAAGRLVTLKGLGGAGKTRLARQVGRRIRTREGRDVSFVDLSESRTAGEAVAAVATALGLPLGRGDTGALADQVAEALRARDEPVVLLDNLEQVLAVGPIVEGWAAAGVAHFLVTSREPLRVRAERVVEVGPLSIPEAVDLMVQRATERGARIDPADPVLPELAASLDGLPLALELAAGRFGVLSPAQVHARLGQRLKLLVGRGSGRQGNLAAALDWSWDLLEPAERDAVAQLSVFAGGFVVEDAEAVLDLGPTAPWVLDVLDRLLDRSLITARRGPDGVPRFGMYESVRVWATAKLEAAGGTAAARVRHQRHFAQLGTEEALLAYRGPGGTERLQAAARSRDNLVAASDPAWGDPEAAARCAIALATALRLGGASASGLPPLARAVAALGPGATRARALLASSWLAAGAGDLDPATELCRHAIAEAQACRHDALIASSWQCLGMVLQSRGQTHEAMEAIARGMEALASRPRTGDPGAMLASRGAMLQELGRNEEAMADYRVALEIHRRAGDRRGEAVVTSNLAMALYDLGRVAEARAHFEVALALHAEALDRRLEALARNSLAHVLRDVGDGVGARAQYDQALAIQRSLGNRMSQAVVLGNLAMLLHDEGDSEAALAHLDRAVADHRAVGAKMWEGMALASRGSVRADLGAYVEAAEDLDEAATIFLWRDPRYAAWARARAAEVRAITTGEPVWDTLDEVERIIEEGKMPATLCEVRCVRARLLARAGDHAGAEAALDRAIEAARPLGLAPRSATASHVARTRVVLDRASGGG